MNNSLFDLFLKKNKNTNIAEVNRVFGWIGQIRDISIRNAPNGTSTVILKMKNWHPQFQQEFSFAKSSRRMPYTNNQWCVGWRISNYVASKLPALAKMPIGRDNVAIAMKHNPSYCDEYGRDVELRVRMLTKSRPNYVYSADLDKDQEVTTNINEINNYNGVPRFMKIVLINGKFQRRFYD